MTSSRWFLGAVVLFVGAVSAAAATDLEVLQKQVAKVAPDFASKPKALCACAFGSGVDNSVGFIRQQFQNGRVVVICSGDQFDAGGNANSGFNCNSFYPLVK